LVEGKRGEVMAKDPVCGMDVDERTAQYKTEHMGKTYYFCAAGCKAEFERNPMKYLKEEHGSMGHR